MNHRILIVAAAEGFIIKGLETKLKGIGVESRFSTPKVKKIEELIADTDLVVVFTDDSVTTIADVLVYIKDRCSEADEQIVFIGAREEYDVVKGYVSANNVLKFYERPLDVEQLVSEIAAYMEDEVQAARRKSILIVDDDVAYMSMIMDWLKDKYRISLANSGMQAITWLAKNHADLILLDYEMPVTSGPQVLEMIRSDAENADIPVMFLTGKGDKESIMKVLALKPVGYQLKSIQREQLRENIEKFFATQKAK